MAQNLDIHQSASRLALSYQALLTAYTELSQLRVDWPKELDDYLYDEKYRGLTAGEFADVVIGALEVLKDPLHQLSRDSHSLSNDLFRVGRGDGFRV